MNGRIYDPGLGRFLSADTIIQAPNNTQSYNRYSYVWNNPLRHTDPSGHVVFTLGAMAWAITQTTVQWHVAAAVFGAAGFADSLMQGASLSDAFQSGLIAGAAAGAFSAIGASNMDFIAGSQKITQTLAFGAVGGITSSLHGGKFGHGFVSAGLGAAVGFSEILSGIDDEVLRVVSKTIIGGTISEVTGGKFANGAATAAFASIVSEAAHGSHSFGGGSIARDDGRSFFQKLFGFRDVPRGIVTIEELNYPGGSTDIFVSGSASTPMVGRIYSPFIDNVYTGYAPGGRGYRASDPAGNQAARVLQAELEAVACVAFLTACSAYGAAETTANFVQNPNAMDATSLGYELYKSRFGGSHPVNQAVDMAVGEFLDILPRE